MPKTILETPCYRFTLYDTFTRFGESTVKMNHVSGRSVILTSKETESFLHDHADWQDHTEPHYLAGMLWEAHAAPILNEIDMKGKK